MCGLFCARAAVERATEACFPVPSPLPEGDAESDPEIPSMINR
jgi:hypothetical protein